MMGPVRKARQQKIGRAGATAATLDTMGTRGAVATVAGEEEKSSMPSIACPVLPSPAPAWGSRWCARSLASMVAMRVSCLRRVGVPASKC